MSLEKIEKDEFLLVRYCQDAGSDHTSLKKGLEEEITNPATMDKDTILEFITTSAIYSMEIGIIVQYLKTFHGTKRTLRFVGSVYVREMLRTMNIHRIPNIELYDSLDALQLIYPAVDFSALECG